MTWGPYSTAASLRATALALREFASHFDGRTGIFGDDVAAGDRFVETAAATWHGPRSHDDLACVRAYLDAVRPMVDAISNVATKATAFAGDADTIAGYLDTHEATLADARADTPAGESLPNEAWLAQRGIEDLHLDWLAACRRHGLLVAAAMEPLEAAYQAEASGFSAPVVTGGDYLSALIGLAASAGVDLERLGHDAAAVRRHLEHGLVGDGHALVVVVLSNASSAEAVAYWNSLTDEERIELIETRPDVAAKVLEAGGMLSAYELEQLDGANAYPVFSEEFMAEFELSARLRVATIFIGEDFTLVAMRMSDGTVQVAVAKGVHHGVGVEAENGEGEAEAAIGLFTEAQQVFVFPSEESAASAIHALEDAVEDVGIDDVAIDWFLEPLLPEGANIVNEFEAEINNLWDDYGMVATFTGGVYAEAEVEIQSAVEEAELEGEVHIAVYDTDTTELATEPARSGIIVAGSLGVHGEAGSGAGPSGGAEGVFTIDAYTNDDGDEFVTITVNGSASLGIVGEIVDRTALEWDSHAEAGVAATVEITVPADELGVGLGDIATSLARGQLPSTIDDLYDAADIRVSVDTTAELSTETEFQLGTVELNVDIARSESQNVITLHKYPDGEFFSQNHVDGLIDTELGIDPEPEPDEHTVEPTVTGEEDGTTAPSAGEEYCAALPPRSGLNIPDYIYDSDGNAIATITAGNQCVPL